MDRDTQKRHLLKKLGELKEKDFLPQGLIALIEPVAVRQYEAFDQAKVIIPAREDLPGEDEILQGRPLVARSEFPFDPIQAKELFSEFMDVVAALGEAQTRACEVIRKDMESGDLDLEDCVARFLEGDDDFFAKFGEKNPDAPRTLSFLIQAAMTPSLEAAAVELAKSLPETRTRQYGHCPVCGSLPYISSLREKEGYRHATCSFCRTSYRIRRLACPYCDQNDQDKLKFFTAKEEPGYRVDVCNGCKGYIKTADFRALDKVSVPHLDDIESLAMDLLATEAGYIRPTLSAWGF